MTTTHRPARFRRVMRLQQQINEQRQWIEDHGGSLAGYVYRYGSKHDLVCYGSGGEQIYAADLAALQRLYAELASIYAQTSD